MRVPDEKTKGFNILELIVVLLIVGIVSALGYPEITKWRKDREVKSFAIATKTLIEGIVAQVQRGQYSFVQFSVYTDTDTNEIVIETNGLGQEKFAALVRDKWNGTTPKPFHRFDERCSMEIDWDDEGATSNELTVNQIKIDKTKVLIGMLNNADQPMDIPDSGGNICFSKDGTF